MHVDEFLKREVNRRQFLGSSAKNAAGVAAGMVGLSSAVSHGAKKSSPNERVAIAVIGVRGRGAVLAAEFAALSSADVLTLCDIDRGVIPRAAEEIAQAQGWTPRFENDFRRVLDDQSLDAVVIATPDHWHALMTARACQAGQDVYVEAPIGHSIGEGARMFEIVRNCDRVVQTGLQQRSGAHFQSAIEFVQNGGIGEVRLARAWTVHKRKPIGQARNARNPEGVDYDLWLGPAAKRPFNPNRFHHNWRWFWDYGSGELGRWGVHMLDVARWGLGVEFPLRIASTGGKFHFHDDQETPDTQVVHYSFPGKTIVWEHRSWSNRGLEGRSAAVAFYGDQGTLVVDRGGWKAYDIDDPVAFDGSELNRSHCQDFIDCVKSRSTPAADIEVGHVTSALCHLGNVSQRLRRELTFDAANLTCADDEANRLLSARYRKPWVIPEA